ncbi:hypothetical protein [Pantoea vagans]|uniref:hypothetical protein n=1 Tax=Pantoea vagans TaxID=470934 RepID=UPI0023B0FE1E|nr:hypothetical protein [Pantoea vagans]MDE8558935.1 hypothetical protein [Pantoea vagans]MDE8578940.1 hypothetical protein [Pantoea vagans]
MQMAQQQHGEPERVYTMIGAVVMAMAGDGLETTRLRIAGFIRGEPAMPGAIGTQEICPDQDIVEFHRDEDGRVL